MRTAGGETVALTITDSGSFGRLVVSLGRRSEAAFLDAAQLRTLASQCERMAAHLERYAALGTTPTATDETERHE